MDLSSWTGTAEVVGGAVLFLMFVLRQVKIGARDAWREEAEVQTVKADRLGKDVSDLVNEVRQLRAENEALRVEVGALRMENRELREHIDRLLQPGGTA
ncbi:hypothetical protein OH828_14455 [Streptomyces anulatus]|uniref:hypothetical protein n=1 Tax=Streptomyces anulatus TaxID=1892 RepID=UPI003865FF4C